jgi:tRNA(adenine34) deaminase
MFSSDDEVWMQRAIAMAKHAEQQNEVPVGAVLVANNELIAEGWNQAISNSDPTAHAEIIALRQAGRHFQNYRLPKTTLYVTLEPCAMCASALIHARIERLVFAAKDPKAGAVSSQLNLLQHPLANHVIQWQQGLQQEECATLLQNFFKARR